MTKGKKRYVVTYSDDQSGKEALSETLNISTADIEDGLDVMSSNRTISDADVLHFDNLNTSVVSLTDKEKAELAKKPGVLEVVEDFEMHALDVYPTYGERYGEGYGTTNGLSEFDGLDGFTGQATDAPTSHEQTVYLHGYSAGYQAMQQAVRSLLAPGDNGKQADLRQPSFPNLPVPQPPIPNLPPILRPIPFPFPFPRPFPWPPIVVPNQPIPWNIQSVNAPAAWQRGIRGEGVKVAILDTGIGPHSDLIVAGGASFISGVGSFTDDNGHGTHCAGITGARNNAVGVVGVAPRCQLYAVKVLDAGGSGPFSGIVAGLGWALANRMDVVSMSLGAVMPCQNAPAALVSAINQLMATGCIVVAAAGNSFGAANPADRFVGVPGSIPGVIAVGATNQANQIAPFSSRGGGCNQVTISAPGVSINSTFPTPPNGYKPLSGTSMACPHVAGAAALVKQRFPGISVAAARFKLTATATDLGVPGNDTTFGAGLVNCDHATL